MVYLKRGGSRRDSGFGGNAVAGILVMGIVMCEFFWGNARVRKLIESDGLLLVPNPELILGFRFSDFPNLNLNFAFSSVRFGFEPISRTGL
jgi:hypothetical protein